MDFAMYEEMNADKRFFIEKHELKQNTAEISSQYNYISKVMRVGCGDEFTVCISDGYDYLCRVTKVDAKTVYCDVIDKQKGQNENAYSLTLFFGILKGDKTDFVVQKAVELGASEIVAFRSAYSVADCSESKLARLNKISLSASEQCQRSVTVPVRYCTFKQMTERLSQYEQVLFCYEKETQTKLQCAINKDGKKTAVVIGSEGGFNDAEAKLLAQTNAQSVSLGKRILRAETASIYALSVLDSILNA